MAIATIACLVLLHSVVPRTLFDLPTSTVVTDRHGTLVGARIAADEQWRFPSVSFPFELEEECVVTFGPRPEDNLVIRLCNDRMIRLCLDVTPTDPGGRDGEAESSRID